MSQKSRNLRRYSEPVPACHESKQKIVTAQHAVPVAACCPSSADVGDDYERNVQSLSEEFSKSNPNSNRLLTFTHSIRRSKIENCDLRASQLRVSFLWFKEIGKCMF